MLILGWTEPRDISAADIADAELAADRRRRRLRPPGGRGAPRRRRRPGPRRRARRPRAQRDARPAGDPAARSSHEAALALGADFTGVYLGNAERGRRRHRRLRRPRGWHGLRIARRRGRRRAACWRPARPFVTNDYQHESAARPGAGRCRRALAVPMVWNDELRGVLSIGWTTRRRIHDEDLHTLEAIAGLATVACRNAEAYEHVQHVARTDALTGVLNHGAMQVRIREEIARARRDGTPLGAVILDLDDFKSVNDTRGHAAGDELLRQVARALQDELRPYDQVARYGGDEFVLLLPGSDEETTAHVAERCRDAIGGKCSIGVAAWHDGLDADGLLEQADRALMLAKRTGKGRVAVANPEVERELALLQSAAGSPAAVQALAAAIEERDDYTREHSDEVVRLSRGVAMMLGLRQRRRRADRPRRAPARRRQARDARRAARQARPADAARSGT